MYNLLITYNIVDLFSNSKKYYNHEVYFLDSIKECDFLFLKRKYELESKYSNNNCLNLEECKHMIYEVVKSKINYV